MTEPGARLRTMAARVCSAQTMARLIDPIVSDLRREHAEARQRGAWSGRRTLLVSYLGFWKAVLWHAAGTIGAGGGDRAMARAVAASALACAVITALLTVPPLRTLPSVDIADRAWLSLYLIPQALPLSLPTGICVGVLLAMRARSTSPRHLVAAFVIGVAATAVSLVLMQWIVPAANQAFRDTALTIQNADGRTHHLERGLNELQLTELAARDDARSIASLYLKLALACAAIPLAVVALALAVTVRRAVTSVVVAMLMSYVYFSLLWVFSEITPEYRWGVSPLVQVWLPNVIVLAGAVVLWHARQRTA